MPATFIRRQGRPTTVDYAKVNKLLEAGDLTISQIADKAGCGYNAVYLFAKLPPKQRAAKIAKSA